ncbi:MAG: cytochrome c oxidase subunit I [Sumerlaeia bacterium]
MSALIEEPKSKPSADEKGTPAPHFPEHPLKPQRNYGAFLNTLGSTDHKVLGILYLVFALAAGILGGAFAGVIRAQLTSSNLEVVSPEVYNMMVTMHASVMIFFVIIPAMAGFGNYLVPLMIGARDMAFPRMNAFSFWILIPAAILALGSFFVEGGAAQAGWTAYPPLSLKEYSGGPGVDMWVLAVHLAGISSITGAINFIVTIFNMRCPGMSLMKMPLFVWTWLVNAWMILVGTPVLAGAVTMILTDRAFGTNFFKPASGGDPVLYQHLFWFYSHPAVYIMVLPGFGIISHVLASFSRKRIFGYVGMVWAIALIGVIGFLVWGHHMFSAGISPSLRLYFSFMTMLIALPTGIKIFSWLATMWGGTIRFTAAMKFAFGFVSLFTIGGFGGLYLANVPFDIQVHDSYFVVGHFHYVLVGGSIMAMFAGAYFFFPKMAGRFLDEKLGNLVFWLWFIGVNVTFLPMHLLGVMGMARRIWQYRPEFEALNAVVSLGYVFMAAAGVIFVYSIVKALRQPRIDPSIQDPWHINDVQQTLIWAVPSPPPAYNFDKIPVIK